MEIYDPLDINISKSLKKNLNFIKSGIDDLNDRKLSEGQREKILDYLIP